MPWGFARAAFDYFHNCLGNLIDAIPLLNSLQFTVDRRWFGLVLCEFVCITSIK